MFFQTEVAALLIRVLTPDPGSAVQLTLEKFGAAFVAWTLFGGFFVAGIREINFSKGGSSMFVIVPKKE